MTPTTDAVQQLLAIPCSRHTSSIPTCPECGTPMAVWAEIERLRRRVDELRPMAAHGVRNPPEVIDEMREELDRLRAELEAYRSSVTTGGPPAPITEGWTPGDSSRPPTAPPEELVVALPVSDEEFGALRYGTCEDCGQPHPAWISCEAETRR